MQPVDFLYFITDDQGRSYSLFNGIVQAASTPAPLKYTPDGWQDKSIKYARNTDSLGLWRTFTTPLKFVKDGSFILRDALYRYGTERKLYLVIHRLDKSYTGGWVHRLFYKGELDLSQVEDNDTYVSVNIMEGDLIKYYNANKDTEYEIDIEVPDAVPVKMDGVELKYEFKMLGLDSEVFFSNVDDFSIKAWFPTFFRADAGQQLVNVVTQDIFTANATGYDITNDNKYWIIKALADVSIPVTFNFDLSLFKKTNIINGNFKISLFKQDGSVLHEFINIDAPTAGTFLQDVNVNQTITLNLNSNDRVYIIFQVSGTPFFSDPFLKIIQIESRNPSGQFNYFSRWRTTFVKGLRPAYIAQQLLDKMTGGGFTFVSNYLSTEWDNLLLTSGDAIRAYDPSGNLYTGVNPPKLKISWSAFYDSYNVPANICEFIRNQQLFIEKKEVAFQSYIQQDLGEVTDLVVSTAKDFQFNVVKIGYPNTDTEDTNGKDEFNVTVTYTSPITRVNKTLELVSKASASMHEIESLRINTDGKPTTDDNSDTRAFFLHVEKSATTGTTGEPASYYKLLRNTYTSVTGLLSPSTAFNLELHPELCLYRHGNFLRSVFYWQDAGSLVYQTSDKNGDVVVMNGSTTYIGNKTIRIGSLAPALFVPLTFKYKSPIGNDFVEIMDNGPDGTFSLTYGGVPLLGFPMDAGIQPANRPAQESILLCSPQTDLTKLITLSR